MLIPIKHENMEARRWPVITIALIVINTVVFIATTGSMSTDSHALGTLKAHIIVLAGMHPELKVTDEAQHLVDNFKQNYPAEWEQLPSPNRKLIDGWDAKMRLVDDTAVLQAEMDSLTAQYAQMATTSIQEQYAFVPAHRQALSYLTANFLHGGWLHLIGNMWFLWLAGFVLEDVWGRPIYLVFYLIAGAAALQFYAWTNPSSIVPCVGASGAVAALMGAFLVRFPKMKIEMLWIFGFFRTYRFQAAAYWLLPLWVGMEVFYGSLFGKMTGVAHWAHVGGFAFGALGAVALRYSGAETHVHKAIEKDLAWQTDAEIEEANQHLEHSQFDEASAVIEKHLAAKPNSIDGWNVKRQIHWRKNEIEAYQEATAKTCEMHLKARNGDAAWHDYEDFLRSGGTAFAIAPWFGICQALEECGNHDRALCEYENLAAAYPAQRQGLMATLAAARICLRKLSRPADALKYFKAAGASAVPHLDLDNTIQAGIKEATTALAGGKALAAGAGK